MKRKRKAGRVIALILAVIVVMALAAAMEIYRSKYDPELYRDVIVSDKIAEQIRVVQLTDLHNSVFGEDNRELVELVADQSPDLILLTGDMLNSCEERTDIALDLVRELCKIAPVYASMGNHEAEYCMNYGVDLIPLYEAAGAVVLDMQYLDIQVKGQRLRIGGGYKYFVPEKYMNTGEAKREECNFLNEMQDTERFSILLTHMPVCWIQSGGLDEWDIDCVFSGHVHGGEVILPLIGGLYGPDFGWFSGRLQGLYFSEDGTKTLVLSRGLGTSQSIPRFNNRPEVVVIDFVPEG